MIVGYVAVVVVAYQSLQYLNQKYHFVLANRRNFPPTIGWEQLAPNIPTFVRFVGFAEHFLVSWLKKAPIFVFENQLMESFCKTIASYLNQLRLNANANANVNEVWRTFLDADEEKKEREWLK